MINLDLAKNKGLDDLTIETIQNWQDVAKQCIEDMQEYTVKDDQFWVALENWRKSQKKLQDLWGFDFNESMWQEWRLPGCECPYLDNKDAGCHRYINEGCPIHGNQKNN